MIDKYSDIAHVLDPVVHKKKFMTRTRGGGGDEDIEGLQKFLDTRREGSEKIVGLEEGLWKFVEWFSTEQFNDLCNSAISRGL